MKKLGIGLVLSAIVGCSSAPFGADGEDGAPPSVTPGTLSPAALAGLPKANGNRHHVVVFKSETSVPADLGTKVTKAGGKVLGVLPSLGVALVDGPASFDDNIAKDGSVLASGPEHRWTNPKTTTKSLPSGTPTDEAYPLQWNIRRTNAPAAWNNVGSTGNTTVAVIDVGVAYDHPEFEREGGSSVIDAKTFSVCQQPLNPNAPPDGDRPGYPEYSTALFVDAATGQPLGCAKPADFGLPVAAKTYEWHGTHVAGIVGANSNAWVVAGVAPGINLASYKVFERTIGLQFDSGGNVVGIVEQQPGASDFAIWSAIDDASAKGYSVINMSLGGNVNRNEKGANAGIQAWNRVAKAAAKRGTLLVAAAGNDGKTLNGTLFSIPSDLPSIVAVGASATTTEIGVTGLDATDDVRASYSNWGGSVDLYAPGGDFCAPPVPCNIPNLVLSSAIAWDNLPVFDNEGNVVFVIPPGGPIRLFAAGTSMASPHVAAVAALVRAKHHELSPAAVKARLKDTARATPFGPMVDAAAATAL